jgi:hypothetical protein
MRKSLMLLANRCCKRHNNSPYRYNKNKAKYDRDQMVKDSVKIKHYQDIEIEKFSNLELIKLLDRYKSSYY